MEKWSLPQNLQITDPKVLAQAEQMQKELAARANSPFANLSVQDHARVRAIRIVDELKENLSYIEKQLGGAITKGGDDESLKKAKLSVLRQLAEQYAVVGRFDLAAQLHPDQAHKDEYVSILEAINRDDSETCQCGPGRDYVEKDVWSFRHNRTVSIIKCTGCGLRNAKDLPKHLLEQRNHRSKAAMLTANMTPSEAAERLNREGHTTKNLIK